MSPWTSLRRSSVFLGSLTLTLAVYGQELKIHVINVGWGSSVLLEGPTGKHVLLEAGDKGKGSGKVVPYLRTKGITSLDAIVLGHMHMDHGGGLPEVNASGFNAPVNYWNGSSYSNTTLQSWVASTKATIIKAGDVIDLGGGATATCIAADGRVIGDATNYSAGDENDNSAALLISYKNFKYIWESDLGGAADSEDTCSGRTTSQMDIEVPMIRAISPGGAHPLITSNGVDIIHVGHHGSQSSTHPVYVRMTSPKVAMISVGQGQSGTWALPYKTTVEKVLLGGVTGCAGVPAPLVIQTEDGDQNYNNQRSTAGYAVGNILVHTDGSQYWVSCNSDNGDTPYIAAGTLASERAGAGIPLGTERVFIAKGGVQGNTVTATIKTPSIDQTVPTGTTLSFVGAGTDSSTTATMTYTWSFEDGSSASGTTANHTFTNTGTTPVTDTVAFTVKDNTGATATTSRLITVTPATANKVTATITTPSADQTIASGTTVSFAGTGTDSSSTATLSYAWNFGDGTTATGASVSHAFTNTGTVAVSRPVVLTVTDNSGVAATATRTMTVSPVPPASTTWNAVDPCNTKATANVVGDTVGTILGYFKSTKYNDNWFAVKVAAGHTFSVNMTGPTASGQDYDLYLMSASGTKLSASEGASTTEKVSWKNSGTSAVTIYIDVKRLTSYSSATPYRLALTR